MLRLNDHQRMRALQNAAPSLRLEPEQNLPTPRSQTGRRETGQFEPMPSPEEKEIVEELDREVAQNGSLIALVACLALAGSMFVAVTMDMLRPG
jgi:hypothetical protein